MIVWLLIAACLVFSVLAVRQCRLYCEPWNIRARWVCTWVDCWVGVYWDAKKRRLYVLPVPCCGVSFERPSRCCECGKIIYSEETFDYCGRPHCCSCKCAEEDFDSEYA